jgi:hypothetical protein
MNPEIEKSKAFVSRLLSNPAISMFTPLQKEEQIIQFLHVNAAQLFPTLSSQNFFPGKNWNQIFSIMLEGLFAVVDTPLMSELQDIINTKINLTFISYLRQQHVSHEKVKAQIFSFLASLLKKNDARRDFTGPYSAISYGVIGKYVEELFNNHSYGHFELTKVQRLRMGKEEIKHMIFLTLLLKPAIHIMAAEGVGSQQERQNGVVQGQFAEKVLVVLKKQLMLLPEQLLKSIVHTSLSFSENRFIEATARISAVFASRCKSYHPNMSVDRGADTPDKSWLNIARRNYKFYGFDIKLLDEFYKIAAENGW